ncbi:Mut7-C RNAse domain-containing protein [Nitratiruptor sp. YY09-18]|uniref:Mut7-C RNAse domain-containing protein n=1 Tax=Nitratiruptor sp. YY09-18 TaxID=2724901 RepID=UPI001916A4CF|nr:Mut7-C RNAse domain-containing protein [Nitratiruptor sp. YY09-18]
MDCSRFVADVHLAKLAKYLRLLGFDTLYFHSISDNALKKIAQEQNRIILTKDKELSLHPKAYLVKSQDVAKQIKEILHYCNTRECHPWSRCLVDNTPLIAVQKSKVEHLLPPKVKKSFENFWQCPKCGRVYWHGSHYERMQKFIDEVCDKIQVQSGQED